MSLIYNYISSLFAILFIFPEGMVREGRDLCVDERLPPPWEIFLDM